MRHWRSAGMIMAALVAGVEPVNAWAEAKVIGTVSKSSLSGSAPGGADKPPLKHLP